MADEWISPLLLFFVVIVLLVLIVYPALKKNPVG